MTNQAQIAQQALIDANLASDDGTFVHRPAKQVIGVIRASQPTVTYAEVEAAHCQLEIENANSASSRDGHISLPPWIPILAIGVILVAGVVGVVGTVSAQRGRK